MSHSYQRHFESVGTFTLTRKAEKFLFSLIASLRMLQGVWTLVEAIHKNAKMLGATF